MQLTTYSVALFLHVTATMALVSALSIEGVVISRIRRDARPSAMRSLMGLISVTPVVATASLVVLLLSGGFMTDRRGEWVLAWPKVALVMLITIGATGAIAGGRFRKIRRTIGAGDAGDSGLIKGAGHRGLAVLLSIRIVLVLGAVLLMTAQPGLAGSLSILAVSLVCGLSIGQRGSISQFDSPKGNNPLEEPKSF